MPRAVNSSPILLSTGPVSTIDVDLLVVPWFEREAPAAVAGLDQATGRELARALSSQEFAARPFDWFITPVADGSWKPRRIAFVGAGTLAGFDIGVARRVATMAA